MFGATATAADHTPIFLLQLLLVELFFFNFDSNYFSDSFIIRLFLEGSDGN